MPIVVSVELESLHGFGNTIARLGCGHCQTFARDQQPLVGMVIRCLLCDLTDSAPDPAPVNPRYQVQWDIWGYPTSTVNWRIKLERDRQLKESERKTHDLVVSWRVCVGGAVIRRLRRICGLAGWPNPRVR